MLLFLALDENTYFIKFGCFYYKAFNNIHSFVNRHINLIHHKNNFSNFKPSRHHEQVKHGVVMYNSINTQ